jgi:ERCC4-related helicase
MARVFCVKKMDFDSLDSLTLLFSDPANEPDMIESPRSYQIEILEKAMKGNVIAILDTGSGKTLSSFVFIISSFCSFDQAYS